MIDKQKIRAIFKEYRQEITELREQIESSYHYQDEAISRCERRAEDRRREQADRERQEEADRWYREDQLKSATKDLERARSYRDDYEVSRAIEKLKRLN